MHTGGCDGTSCAPSKDFKKLDHKNAIKHKKRGPSNPSEELENDCASMKVLLKIVILKGEEMIYFCLRYPMLQDDPVYRPATAELFNRTQSHIMTR